MFSLFSYCQKNSDTVMMTDSVRACVSVLLISQVDETLQQRYDATQTKTKFSVKVARTLISAFVLK